MNYPIDASSYHVRGYMLQGCQKAKAASKQAKPPRSIAETKRNTDKDTAPQVSCPTGHCRGRFFLPHSCGSPTKISTPLAKAISATGSTGKKGQSPSLLVTFRAMERDPHGHRTPCPVSGWSSLGSCNLLIGSSLCEEGCRGKADVAHDHWVTEEA